MSSGDCRLPSNAGAGCGSISKEEDACLMQWRTEAASGKAHVVIVSRVGQMETPISSWEALGGLNLQRTPQICLCLGEVWLVVNVPF